MSASVTCSSTSRRLARSATHTSGSRSAAPPYDELVGPDALHRGQRTLDRPQHVGHGDLVGGPGELVAAVGAPPGADDPGPAQLGEDVLEEILRDPLRRARYSPLTGLPVFSAAASSTAARTA